VSIYVGIDPGRHGSVCWLNVDEAHDIVGMGWRDLPYDGNGWVHANALRAFLMIGPVPRRLVIEEFLSRYGSAAHHLSSQSYGRITAVLDMLALDWRAVRPVDWKRGLGLIGSGKDGSIALANRLLGKHMPYPPTRDDEAEAALLAWLAMNDDPNGRKTSYRDRSARAKLARRAAKMTRGKAHRSGSRSWPAKE
jgi:hypothetical protein